MRISEFDDSALVKLYQSGNEAALEVLVQRYKTRLFSYIVVRIGERELAEDVIQDCFIKVIQTLRKGNYNEEGKFLPWVMRIAHNLIIDHFRRAKRMPKAETSYDDFDLFDVLDSGDRNAEQEVIRQQKIRMVRDLIAQLPEEQREVLIMRQYADMSFKEIAERTGVSINTALGRMRYALINLRKMMPVEQSFLS